MRLGSDHGAIGVPGIVKLAVAFGVLGVLGYDTFVTIATHLKAESDAQNAAYAASQRWFASSDKSAQTAYDAAVQYIQGNNPGDHVCRGDTDPLCGHHGLFTVDPDGTVHLVVRRAAKTLIFSHLGFMHNLLIAYEQGDANQSHD